MYQRLEHGASPGGLSLRRISRPLKKQTISTTTADQQQEEQEVRVSELFNTLLFTQQQEEEQEVRVSQLFNTLLFTQ